MEETKIKADIKPHHPTKILADGFWMGTPAAASSSIYATIRTDILAPIRLLQLNGLQHQNLARLGIRKISKSVCGSRSDCTGSKALKKRLCIYYESFLKKKETARPFHSSIIQLPDAEMDRLVSTLVC